MLDRKLEPLCHIVSVNMVHELGAKAGIQIPSGRSASSPDR
jgi:hypothetical protein